MIANLESPTKTRTWSSHDHEKMDGSMLSEPVMDLMGHYTKPSVQIVHTNNVKLDSFENSVFAINALTGSCHAYRSYEKALERSSAILRLIKQVENTTISRPNYIDKNLYKINKMFNQRLESFSCKEFSKNVIKESFESVAMQISTLNFIDILVFINNTNKIKFSISFSKNRILVINKSFELVNELNDDNLIIFSLFINDELVASGVNEISNFIDGFKKYLDS
ncbi:hypothetical protein IRZ83_16385 [Flavobacterium sp. JLP]|uniref:hypothetical protein n=1 Tax=Flavobacterium sp. JLP TaxID=2783793 RepID=UPI00188D84D2|nr:hypothetical protein [Flavobacterium sp. JLP]MBF4508256.1 hypothetical protein [Flavobacterium sp. JLP]